MQNRQFQSTLEYININNELVLKALNQLKIDKSPGPDGIHNRVLYETREQIIKPLVTIMQSSFESSELPLIWKKANVVPIFKKGNHSDPNNYRPISLTSTSCKLLETIIRDSIIEHLEQYSLLGDSQHGFRPGRSCNTQLLEVISDWADAEELGLPVDVIYLDYRKAFDSVPFERLLSKLEAYGIRGKVKDWIRNFLYGRTQEVVIEGKKSKTAPVTSGIPQGSVLGPLLFLIYVNDLPDMLDSNIQLFADDTKIFRTIQSQSDALAMQNDLSKLMTWSKTWQLPFNTSKCKVLHLGSKNPETAYTILCQDNTVDLAVVTEEKDLGIKFDCKLNFSKHISEICSKGKQRIGLIRRNFRFIDKKTFLILYKSLVRPLLEYCNTVWYPTFKKDSRAIKSVQRKATKLVKYMKNWSYPERLRELGLPTMIYRRRRADVLQIFRIICGTDKVQSNKIFQLAGDTATRGHSLKIYKLPKS